MKTFIRKNFIISMDISKSDSEDQLVFIFVIKFILHSQNVTSNIFLFFFTSSCPYFGGNFDRLLFFKYGLLILYALQSIEIFSFNFIKLTLDPLNGPFDFRDDDKLKSVYSSVRDLDYTLDSYELGLERSNHDEQLKILGVPIFCSCNSLTTSHHSKFIHFIILLLEASDNEGWLLDTGNVIIMELENNRGILFDSISDSGSEISSSVSGFYHPNLALIVFFAHSFFCLDDSLHNTIECLFKSIRLFLE